MEVDSEDDSVNSEYKPLAGHRLLVITDDEKLCYEIKTIASSMSLVVDFVANTPLGVWAAEGIFPMRNSLA